MDQDCCSPPLVPGLIFSVMRLDYGWFDGELDDVVDRSWVLENDDIRLCLLSVGLVVYFYRGEHHCVLLGVYQPVGLSLELGVELVWVARACLD